MSSEATERNYPSNWLDVQYRWTLACELIRAVDHMHVIAYAGNAHEIDHVRLRNCQDNWDGNERTRAQLARTRAAAKVPA